MPDYCDDCGAEAVGRFDVAHWKVKDGRHLNEPGKEEISTVVRARALCQRHHDIRVGEGLGVKPSGT